MIKCQKCESDLPNDFKYCIYCSAKLPKTEKNSIKSKSSEQLSAGQIGLLVGVFLLAVVAIFAFVTLTK